MLDRLAAEVFGQRDPAEVLHRELSQELSGENGRATLRLALPFAERGDIELKKIGLEVIVRVGGQKRFEEGALEVSFEKRDGAADKTTD